MFLKANEEQTVHFSIRPEEDLSFTGIHFDKVLEQGNFKLMVGNSSENLRLNKDFYIDLENKDK